MGPLILDIPVRATMRGAATRRADQLSEEGRPEVPVGGQRKYSQAVCVPVCPGESTTLHALSSREREMPDHSMRAGHPLQGCGRRRRHPRHGRCGAGRMRAEDLHGGPAAGAARRSIRAFAHRAGPQ